MILINDIMKTSTREVLPIGAFDPDCSPTRELESWNYEAVEETALHTRFRAWQKPEIGL